MKYELCTSVDNDVTADVDKALEELHALAPAYTQLLANSDALIKRVNDAMRKLGLVYRVGGDLHERGESDRVFGCPGISVCLGEKPDGHELELAFGFIEHYGNGLIVIEWANTSPVDEKPLVICDPEVRIWAACFMPEILDRIVDVMRGWVVTGKGVADVQ